MARSVLVDENGRGPLAVVVRQLWAPLLGDDVRAVVGRSDEAGWRTVERYLIVPNAARAKLLIPGRPRSSTVAALLSYQGLRPGTVRLARLAAGTAARLGVAPAGGSLRLQARVGTPALSTPLTVSAEAVGRPKATAAVGVREGANAKATLQLFDPEPVGFAKFAWEEQSARFVEVERSTLEEMAGRTGPVRVPAVLAAGDWCGHPFLVTEPLAADVRRPGAGDGPTPGELLALAPIVRTGLPSDTSHLRALAGRLRAAQGPRDLVGDAVALLERVENVAEPVPVAARWHGDLVPWNIARDGGGTLWVWDWETAEPDAVIGLDAVHWALHAPRRVTPGLMASRLAERLPWVRRTVAEMGGDTRVAAVAVAVHTLAMVDRGLALAGAAGGWDRVLVGPEALRSMVGTAMRVI